MSKEWAKGICEENKWDVLNLPVMLTNLAAVILMCTILMKHSTVVGECCHSQFVHHHYVPRSCQCPHFDQLLPKWCRDVLAREDIIPKLLWVVFFPNSEPFLKGTIDLTSEKTNFGKQWHYSIKQVLKATQFLFFNNVSK